MTTYTWNNSSADWDTPADWNPIGTPGANDTAVIDAGNVTVAGAAVGELDINGGSLTVNGLLGLSALTVSGAVTNAGTFNIGASGLLPALVSVGSITNYVGSLCGVINITGSALVGASLAVDAPAGFGAVGEVIGDVNVTGNALISFTSGQITSVAANSALTLDGSKGLIEDLLVTLLTGNTGLTDLATLDGALNLENGSVVTTSNALTISDTGAIDLSGSQTSFSVGGAIADAGSVTVDAGATLTATGGFNQTGGQTQIAGTLAGSVNLAGGSFDLEAGGSVTGAIAFSGPADLTWQSSQAAAKVLSGISYGDTITFGDVAYAAGDTVGLQSTSGGVETFALESAGGAVLATLSVDDSLPSNFFTVGDNAGNAELVTIPPLAITGTVAGQQIADKQTDKLFDGVMVTDAQSSSETIALSVTLSATGNGTLSDAAGGIYNATTGMFTASGDVANINAVLNGLVFTPTIAHGASETTTFTVSLSNGVGAPATDSTTTVTVSSYVGGGRSLALGGAPGYAVSIYNTNNNWDFVAGSDGTVFITNAQTSVAGGGDIIDLSSSRSDQASLYDTSGNWDAVSGSIGTVYLTDAQASVVGGGDTIKLEGTSGNAVSVYQTNGIWDSIVGDNGGAGTVYLTDGQASVFGGGNAVNFDGTSGNAVSLYNTINTPDVVTGIDGGDGTVYLTDAQASVFGGGQSLYLAGSNNVLGLYATGGVWDSAGGSNASFSLAAAQVSISGSNDAITLIGDIGNEVSIYGTTGGADTVNGSDGLIYLTDAQASISGGGEAIVFLGSAGDQANLSATAGEWDFISGSNGAVNLDNAQASVFGGGESVTLTGPSGNAVSLYNTNGLWDSVSGSNTTIYLTDAESSIEGGGDSIILLGVLGNEVSLYETNGNWDIVSGSSGVLNLVSAQVSIVGDLNTINFTSGSGNEASLYLTNGSADTIDGSNGTVALTSAQALINGGGDTVYFSGGTGNVVTLTSTSGFADAVNGSTGTVTLENAQSQVNGSNNTINMTGNSTAIADGTKDLFAFGQGIGGTDVINGFASSDMVQLSKSDFANFNALSSHISQAAANTVITLNPSDTITLANVAASSLVAGQFAFV